MPQAQGNAASRHAWARARLTRGSSGGAVWEISSDYPEARLTVGADATAGWPIHAPGVLPVHCELFWDGTSLWVADTQRTGSVFLDGQRVSDWVQIHGPSELRFGSAAMDVETSRPMHEQMLSRPDAARPITVTDLPLPPERPSQPIFGGAASDESIPELDGAATRVVASPIAPPADPMASLRPRLGGETDAASGEATRMVAMPAAPPQQPQPVHSPQPGFGPSPVVAPPPPAAPSLGGHPAAFPAAMQPGAFPPAMQPAAPAMQPAAPAMQPVAPAFDGAFVAPPAAPAPSQKQSPFQQILAKLKPQSSADVVEASGGKKGQTLPTRTWIMLGVTVAAALGLLLWESEPPAGAPPPVPTTTAPTEPTPPEPTPPEPTVEPPAPEVVTPSSPVAEESEETSDDDESEEGEDEDAPTLQRQAVDHYVAGRYAESLAIYRQLAQAEPGNRAYAVMVDVLERRVECQDGVGPGGEPCGTR